MNSIEQQVLRAQIAITSGIITQEELARRAGLRGSTLTGMLDESWNPTRRTLSSVVDVLDRIDADQAQIAKAHKAVRKPRKTAPR